MVLLQLLVLSHRWRLLISAVGGCKEMVLVEMVMDVCELDFQWPDQVVVVEEVVAPLVVGGGLVWLVWFVVAGPWLCC